MVLTPALIRSDRGSDPVSISQKVALVRLHRPSSKRLAEPAEPADTRPTRRLRSSISAEAETKETAKKSRGQKDIGDVIEIDVEAPYVEIRK